MASLGDALVNKVLGHSAAEKAFRPWWDSLEDYLIYGLVTLGLIVLPTAIINSTPLDCNLCTGQCGKMAARIGKNASDITSEPPPFNAWWVKKYCTMTAVDGFVLYFPYILLIMAVVIVLIERGFISMFKAGLKLDAFYNLLVSESLLEGTTSTTSDEKGETTTKFVDIEDSKLAIEVAHSFSNSSAYFVSYLIRTVSELLVAIALLAWLMVYGFPIIQKDEFIYCPVHDYYYECAGHPQQFYMYVLFVTIAILAVYIFCCAFNVLWLFVPQLGSLSGVMRKYKNEFKKKTTSQSDLATDQELLGDLYDVYYNNKDLKLLLDLLAASSGIAPCLRILCLFDKELRTMAEVAELSVNVHYNEDKGRTDAIVKFDDPVAMTKIFQFIPGVNCIYTVEITPSIKTGSIHAFKFLPIEEKNGGFFDGIKNIAKRDDHADTEIDMVTLDENKHRMKTKFNGIDPSVMYTIRVCTVINGKTISRKKISIEPNNKDCE